MRDALWSSDPAKINLANLTAMLGRRYNNDAWQRITFVDSHDSADRMARLNESLAPGSGDTLFARRQMLLGSRAATHGTRPAHAATGPGVFAGRPFSDWEVLDWG